MSELNPVFWTKKGVERNALLSGAQEFSTSAEHSYNAGDWVWYKGDDTTSPAVSSGLYVCNSNTTGGAFEVAKWSLMNNVSALFTSANTSLVSSTRYALAASDASSGSTLSDRTINRVTMTTSAQTFAMPNRYAEKARDFIVRVEVGDLETIGGIAFSGVTAWEGDALIFEKNKNYLVAITETKYANNAPTWLIKVLALDSQTQA